MYKVIFSKQAMKDLEKIKRAGLGKKVKELSECIAKNPFQSPPRYEKLVGELQGFYSRRINGQHRYTYAVLSNADQFTDDKGTLYEGIVHVLRVWTHYDG